MTYVDTIAYYYGLHPLFLIANYYNHRRLVALQVFKLTVGSESHLVGSHVRNNGQFGMICQKGFS